LLSLVALVNPLISLIFDFSRENYSINEKNNLAIKNIKELLKRTVKE